MQHPATNNSNELLLLLEANEVNLTGNKTIKKFFKSIYNHDRLTDSRLDEFCRFICLDEFELAKREEVLKIFKSQLNKFGIRCEPHFMGSTINGIGLLNSDMDIYLQMLDNSAQPKNDDNNNNRRWTKNTFSLLFKTRAALSILLKRFYQLTVIRARSCPIVKSAPIQTSQKTIDFDINVTHPIGVFNSLVIFHLVKRCESWRKLFVILKIWAKSNQLISNTGLKSYTLAFMIIFFLQNCEPQYILSLDRIFDYSQNFIHQLPTTAGQRFEVEIANLCEPLAQNLDRSPDTFELLRQFFIFYSNFDYVNFVICPRFGFAIRKDHHELLIDDLNNVQKSKQQPVHDSMRITPYACVEDPFELDRNISSALNVETLDRFVQLCTFYASKGDAFLRRACNFIQFVANNAPSKAIPFKQHDHNFSPCICFIENYFAKQDVAKRFADNSNHAKCETEREQTSRFISEFANAVLRNILRYANAHQGDDFRLLSPPPDAICVDDFVMRQQLSKDDVNIRSKQFDLALIKIKVKIAVSGAGSAKAEKRKQNEESISTGFPSKKVAKNSKTENIKTENLKAEMIKAKEAISSNEHWWNKSDIYSEFSFDTKASTSSNTSNDSESKNNQNPKTIKCETDQLQLASTSGGENDDGDSINHIVKLKCFFRSEKLFYLYLANNDEPKLSKSIFKILINCGNKFCTCRDDPLNREEVEKEEEADKRDTEA